MKVLLLVFLTGYILRLNAWCPQTDSSWQSLGNRTRLSRILHNIKNLDESCFIIIISDFSSVKKRKVKDDLIEMVQKWVENRDVSTELLITLYKNPLIYKNPAIWPAILSGWEKKYVSVNEAHKQLVAEGEFNIADTLFGIYDNEARLNVYDWLKWAKIKNITGETAAIARIYCRIISSEPRLIPIALSQFGYLLRDQEKQVADSLLVDFLRCSLQRNESDTLNIRQWVSRICSQSGLYNRQIEMLKSLNTRNYPVYKELLSVSGLHLSNKRYGYAKDAASAVYHNTKDPEMKQGASFLIYQSFLEQGLKDSALLWLKKIDLKSKKEMTDAASLYQNCGLYDKAQKIIDSIPRSYAADTLQLRQFLFTGNRNKAYSLVEKECRQENMIWTVRTALFDNRISEVTKLLDSISHNDLNNNNGEFLSYRYWFQRLQGATDLLEVWAQIEYNIYIGTYHEAVNLLSAVKESDLAWRLALRVANVLISSGDSENALKLLKRYEQKNISAKFLYSMAEASMRLGETDHGREILERIMLEYPDDIYSGRARFLLLSK